MGIVFQYGAGGVGQSDLRFQAGVTPWVQKLPCLVKDRTSICRSRLPKFSFKHVAFEKCNG